MTTAETAEFERLLAAAGFHYDADYEQFYEGKRPLEVDEVLALMPGLTDDELAAYQDAKFDRRGMSS